MLPSRLVHHPGSVSPIMPCLAFLPNRPLLLLFLPPPLRETRRLTTDTFPDIVQRLTATAPCRDRSAAVQHRAAAATQPVSSSVTTLPRSNLGDRTRASGKRARF